MSEQIVIDGPNMSHGHMAHADHHVHPNDLDHHGAHDGHEHKEPHFIFKYIFSQDHKYIANPLVEEDLGRNPAV